MEGVVDRLFTRQKTGAVSLPRQAAENRIWRRRSAWR
jgi:hypothetical protein